MTKCTTSNLNCMTFTDLSFKCSDPHPKLIITEVITDPDPTKVSDLSGSGSETQHFSQVLPAVLEFLNDLWY
jgi:hypothetical protein